MLLPSIVFLIGIILFVLIFWGLGSATTPLVLSFILSFFLFPVVQRIERLGIKRSAATILVFTISMLLLSSVFIFTIPSFVKESREFLKELPVNVNIVLQNVEMKLGEYGVEFSLNKAQIIDLVKTYSSKITLEMVQGVGVFFKKALSEITGLFIVILNIFLFPVFFYYVITDLEKYGQFFKDLIPRAWQGPLKEFYFDANNVFKSYFRGQFLVALILATFYGVALSFTNLKYGLIIGVITGLLGIIPYIGFSLGFTLAMVFSIANFQGPLPFVIVLIIFGLGQILEGFILTPKLVGKSLGLNPLITMLGLILGGNLGGLIGMIFALPILAVSKVIIKKVLAEFKNTQFYLGA